ncbi:MAG TPA: hypothetical protein VGQ57_16345 [Polyangiaceae bacterium]|jgi:hypothetical protein|nr:hypothetical protein [Polyangiaceae bacterium]
MREKARWVPFVGLASLACGPSLATVREGSVRFEHCYGVDLNPEAQSAQRKACWQQWVTSYTVGQPLDRIEYAERRLRALDGDDGNCPRLALGQDHALEQGPLNTVVPAPTSAHASPPPVATAAVVADAGEPPAEVSPNGELPKSGEATLSTGGAKTNEGTKTGDRGKDPPASACAARCRTTWQSCDAACSSEPKKARCGDCSATYSNCMRGCFD